MANIPGVVKDLIKGVREITWANMANGDVGVPVSLPNYPDKTVTWRGTFGVGGTVSIKGTDSADLGGIANGDILNDSRGEGNALTSTAGGPRDTRTILENPAQIAPHVTAGDGTTSITVVILCTSGLR